MGECAKRPFPRGDQGSPYRYLQALTNRRRVRWTGQVTFSSAVLADPELDSSGPMARILRSSPLFATLARNAVRYDHAGLVDSAPECAGCCRTLIVVGQARRAGCSGRKHQALPARRSATRSHGRMQEMAETTEGGAAQESPQAAARVRPPDRRRTGVADRRVGWR
jgi:hypothetical protein